MIAKPGRASLVLLALVTIVVSVGLIVGVVLDRPQPFPFRQIAEYVSGERQNPRWDREATIRCLEASSDRQTGELLTRILVVGHAYGAPDGDNRGVAPALGEFLSSTGDHWNLIALTGDIVRHASTENFNLVRDQLSPYAGKLVVAPGNHDVGTDSDNAKRDAFVSVFDTTWSVVELSDVLLVFLDLSMDWKLGAEQQEWLEELLAPGTEFSRIIVFTHQLVWADYLGGEIRPNSLEGLSGASDFPSLLSEFLPSAIPVVFVAGDIGVGANPGLFCGTKDGVTYLANGLGGQSDTLIELLLFRGGGLIINPIAL